MLAPLRLLASDGLNDADDVFDDVENILDESQELQDVFEDRNGFSDEAGHDRSDGFDDGEHGGHAGSDDNDGGSGSGGSGTSGGSRWADCRRWKSSCKKEEEKESSGQDRRYSYPRAGLACSYSLPRLPTLLVESHGTWRLGTTTTTTTQWRLGTMATTIQSRFAQNQAVGDDPVLLIGSIPESSTMARR